MAYQSQVPFTEHDVHKAQKVVSGLIGVLQRDVVLPETFNKRSIDLFKGALGDTVTQQFEGNLPWREYEFRNDRTDPIIFDVMTKATATLSLGSRLYSATRLTDEQRRDAHRDGHEGEHGQDGSPDRRGGAAVPVGVIGAESIGPALGRAGRDGHGWVSLPGRIRLTVADPWTVNSGMPIRPRKTVRDVAEVVTRIERRSVSSCAVPVLPADAR